MPSDETWVRRDLTLQIYRGALERRWLASLRRFAAHDAVPAAGIPGALTGLARRAGGPGRRKGPQDPRSLTGTKDLKDPADPGGPDLPGYLARKASRGQFAEYLAHRSVYQLKEADPHSFGIPRRISGPSG
jgi:hypothetical protein